MYLNQYITYLRNEGHPQGTIDCYKVDIIQMLNFIGKNEEDITTEDILDWKGSMTCASATKNRKIMSAKGYFGYLKNMLHVINSTPTEYVKGVKVKCKEKIPLKGDEIRSIIDACKNKRNKALVMLLAATGLRIEEAVSLTYDKYINRINNVIVITGKGDKNRFIGLAPEVCKYIDDYIENERKGTTEYLFESTQDSKVRPRAFLDTLKLTCKKAGLINWKDISPHWLRTTFATMQVENGTPLEVVQKQLGHSNISTTLRYAKIADSRAIEAMSIVNF